MEPGHRDQVFTFQRPGGQAYRRIVVLVEVALPVTDRRQVIVIERPLVALSLGFSESVTMTVKLYVPGVVGVPEITPVDGAMVSPGGKAPTLIDHV